MLKEKNVPKLILLTLMISLAALGCSGAGIPSSPDPAVLPADASRKIHSSCGLWQGVINPQAETIEFTELRTCDFHLNALPFLEPPPLHNLTLESLEFDGDIIEADIGLRHPFIGLTEFTGFDVCGIFISNGSISGFTDHKLIMAGEGDTRLLNPDGYSRWWNPAEFPVDGTMFGYTDGLLGTPDSHADYNSTLNGYKYFCDDLDNPNDPLDDVTLANRGMFSAGQKNVRHYTIQMGDGLIFNYAIDACWEFPQGDAPWNAPDDFKPGANRAEAWRISVTELENTLWNDGIDNGGDLKLRVDVHDWYDSEMNTVRVESPSNFTVVESSSAIGGGAGFSTYEIEITSATPGPDEIELLISVISEEDGFEGFIPGTNTTAYFTYTVPVATEPTLGFTLVLDPIQDIFDSDWEEYSPCITINPSGHIYICYWRIYIPPPYTMGQSTWAYSTNSGVDWVDSNWWCLGTTVMVDTNAPAVDAVGDVYFLGNSTSWPSASYLNKCVTGNYSTDQGYHVVGSFHGNALIFTHDGFPVGFGDRDNHINYKKGTMANHPWSNGSITGWSTQPEYNAVPSPARLSQTHNIERDSSNAIHFVYFSSNDTDTWIRLAYNTDGTGMSWNYDNDIYDGSSDGYDRARDPSLLIDSDGVFHSAFILHKSSPSESERIAYARSTDGLNWDDPVTVYEVSGTDVLNNVTVSCTEFMSTEVVVITYLEDDTIYLTHSSDGGQDWDEPTQLSSGSDSNPHMCAGDDGYVHNVWEHDEGDDRRIEYIRAYFVEG